MTEQVASYPPPDRVTYCCNAGWLWTGAQYVCDRCRGIRSDDVTGKPLAVEPLVVSKPLRGTAQQTQAFYKLLKSICSGEDVPSEHVLHDLHLGDRSTGRRMNVWWTNVAELHSEVGNWEHLLKQLYNAYTHGGPGAAKVGVAVMSIYDEDLVALIQSHPLDAPFFDISVPMRQEEMRVHSHERPQDVVQADAP